MTVLGRVAPAGNALISGVALVCTGVAACSVQDSDLIVSQADAAPATLSDSVIRAIDARPLGGASLTTGTQGGGTHIEARKARQLYQVSTLSALKRLVAGDEPAVVLVSEGRYLGAGEPVSLQVCHTGCEADDPNSEQTLLAKDCPAEAALSLATFTTDELRVGSNKTIIGLGAGARLVDVRVVLDESSNVILRNLAIEEVQRGVVNGANGLSLEAADHVWLDHLTLRDVSRASIDIVSTWDQENAQALVAEAGYITLSDVDFDGFVSASCSQRSELALTTNRNPALTVMGSWFHASRIRAPNLFGPGTWAHLFNNLWSDIDGRGLAVSCGAVALAQGNVFQATHNALYNSDSGPPTWSFCAAGLFGSLYAPTAPTDADTNLLDADSSMNLGGQPSSGQGANIPQSAGGSEFALTVPVASGTRTETYRITLTDPSSVAAAVPAQAGAGHLF